MSPVPSVPGATLRRALEKIGFEVVRINGSHHVMKHPDGRHVVVPIHSGRDLPKGTLRGILSIIGLTVEDLTKLL